MLSSVERSELSVESGGVSGGRLSGESSAECSGAPGLGCQLFLPFVEGMSASERCQRGMNEHWVLESTCTPRTHALPSFVTPYNWLRGDPCICTLRRNVVQRQEGQKQLTDKRSDLITGEEPEGWEVTSSEGPDPNAQTLCLLAFACPLRIPHLANI